MRQHLLKRLLPRAAALLLALTALAACDDDDELGHACDNDRECDEVCAEGKDFPDGVCTYTCDGDEDCPGGWACSEKQGGLCLEECGSDRECRDHFGSRWTCKSVDRHGASGRADVCIGD